MDMQSRPTRNSTNFNIHWYPKMTDKIIPLSLLPINMAAKDLLKKWMSKELPIGYPQKKELAEQGSSLNTKSSL